MLNKQQQRFATKLLVMLYNLCEHPNRSTRTIALRINGTDCLGRTITVDHVEIILALFGGRYTFRHNACIRKLATSR